MAFLFDVVKYEHGTLVSLIVLDASGVSKSCDGCAVNTEGLPNLDMIFDAFGEADGAFSPSSVFCWGVVIGIVDAVLPLSWLGAELGVRGEDEDGGRSGGNHLIEKCGGINRSTI